MDLLKQVEWLSVCLNATKLELRAVFNEGDLESLLHLPNRNLVAKFLHEQLHHIVTLGMDDQGAVLVKWCFLKVDIYKITSILCDCQRHRVNVAQTMASTH